MRTLKTLLMSGLGALAASGALAQTETCTRGDDARTIEVIMPGEVGKACDLRYERGGAVTTPYHADFSTDFCAKKASELVSSLTDAGFACAANEAAIPAPPELRAEATSSSEDGKLVPELDPESAAGEEAQASQAVVAETDAPPGPELVQPAPDEGLDGADRPSGEELSVPEPEIADAGPAALAPTNASAAGDESPPADKMSAPAQQKSVQTAAGARNDNSASAPASAAPKITAPPPAPKPAASAGRRPSEDIIKSVLFARAAAWNEGDLDAFMAGYRNGPDTRLVLGGDITTGWKDILKRYQDRYGSGTEMGRLTFDSLDVQMMSDDVAVVDGRYNLARKEGAEAGSFTLVMKRFDGMWRIVHDNSISDKPPTE